MKLIKSLSKILINIGKLSPYFLVFLVLALSLKGIIGNPTVEELNTRTWQDFGPFDSSPERGRFALIYSIIENRSFKYSLPLARFAIPDLGYLNDQYVSLFDPGLPVILIPGYIIGRFFGASQVGTYSIIAIFAFLNFLLIKSISQKLGASSNSSFLAALAFLFASPAFAYSVNLYQHHTSTFILLISIYSLINWKGLLSLLIIWLLFPLALAIDYPNVFILTPILFLSLLKLISTNQTPDKLTINLDIIKLLLIPVFSLATLYFFFWVHQQAYGNPWQLAGTVQNIRSIDNSGKPVDPRTLDLDPSIISHLEAISSEKSSLGLFNTRNFVNGLNILLFSPDRGIVNYWPIIFLALIGSYFLYRHSPYASAITISLFIINLLIYSAWGDPWGGWAFGPRYLIPGMAVLSIALSFFFENIRKKPLLLILFLLIFYYSAYINSAGALTNVANPPQVEVLNLEEITGREQKYTYQRNLDQLKNNYSTSLYFRNVGQAQFTASDFHKIILSIVMSMALTHTLKVYLEKDVNKLKF